MSFVVLSHVLFHAFTIRKREEPRQKRKEKKRREAGASLQTERADNRSNRSNIKPCGCFCKGDRTDPDGTLKEYFGMRGGKIPFVDTKKTFGGA